MDITTCTTEEYIRVVMIVLSLIAVMYVVFSEYCVCAYGDTLTLPLITASLPQDAWESWVILFLFCLNLTFTYPLVIYPANNIVESYLFKGWPKSPKRQWCKNLSRTLMVVLTIVMGLLLWDSLDKFLSLLGGLACTPIAFILPTLFYIYGGLNKNKFEYYLNWFVVIISSIIAVFCSFWSIYAWNE